MSNKKYTIKDIALEAGVSIATVSKVLNNKDKNISDNTRNRILDIVKKNNYIPNRVASSLVTKNTKTLGLIIPDITNPFFPEIVRGAEDIANLKGYNLILCNTDNSIEREKKAIEMLTEKMVDGIILDCSESSTYYKSFFRTDTPVILVDSDSKITGENIVGKITIDNYKGAYEGVTYLINKGYRNIAMLSGQTNRSTGLHRLEGYKDALTDNFIHLTDDYIVEGTFDTDSGKVGVQKLLERNIPIEAIFCGNDMIAIGAMKKLKEFGYKIPEEIAVMGFDGIHFGSLYEPSLTTIKQPYYDMGYKAGEILINIVKNKNREFVEVLLEFELHIGDSA